MGYRSQWQLLVTGTDENLSKFKKSVSVKTGEAHLHREGFFTPRQVWEGIFGDADSPRGEEIIMTSRSSTGNKCLVYEGTETKCYPPWEDVINQVFELGEQLGLEVAYGRVGEEMGDVELRQSGNRLYVNVSTTINEPDFW